MYKLSSIAFAGFALAACAAAPPDSTAIIAPPASTATATANSSAGATPIATAVVNVTPQPSSVPTKSLNMADFRDDGTRCEELTRPGSRIIVAKRCRTIIEDEDAAFEQGVLSDQLNQVRRDQDELNQARREQKELDQSATEKDSKGR